MGEPKTTFQEQLDADVASGKPLVCKRCGKKKTHRPEDYAIFEEMHWICFHLEFEHGDYDLDLPCEDPDCPWTRIAAAAKEDDDTRPKT